MFNTNYNQPQLMQYPGGYPTPPNPMMQAPPQRYEIIHVNGEGSARAFRMLPNSQCLLLDDTAPIVWLAQSDGSGYTQVTPFTITPFQPNAPQQASLEERLRNVEMRLEAMTNVQPDPANAGKPRQRKPSADPSAGE